MSAERDSQGAQYQHQLWAATQVMAIPPALLRRKLLFWGFRQVVLCVLAWYFWDRGWMRWVFWIGVVFALVHLAMLLYLPRLLAKKAAKAQRRFEAMERMFEGEDEEEEEKEGPDRPLPLP